METFLSIGLDVHFVNTIDLTISGALISGDFGVSSRLPVDGSSRRLFEEI